MLLQIKELSKAFGGLLAVNSFTLSVNKGDLHAIIGPNGAGKTTLFNLISGYLVPDHGKVIFKGKEITGLPPHKICQKGISRSFQRVNIFPKLTVFENVQVALLSHKRQSHNLFSVAGKMYEEEVLVILDTVGLCDQARLRAEALSHGDKKRLELAIALSSEPELLLLDEPTAGMSPEETAATVSLIEKLNLEKGISILFTEHDMAVVFGIARRITVMHQGSLIADGPPEEVKANREVQQIYLGEEVV